MTFLGYLLLAVFLFSFYIAYRIFDEILQKRRIIKGTIGWAEKGFMLFFISILMISLNSIMMVLSYSFFWEKAYRTLLEQQYEAVVIGYKKETVSTKNFPTSGSYNKQVYFPQVKYTNSDGKEVVKTLDLTDNHPPAIGQTLKITDRKMSKEANRIEINWIMLAFGSVFIGLAAFFTCLLTTYIKNESLKKRITISLYGSFIIIVLNAGCILLIVFKH